MTALPGKMSLIILMLGLCSPCSLQAEQVVFTVDSSQSNLTFSGTLDPNDSQTSLPERPLTAQSGTSLTVPYIGSITTNLSDSLEFVSASLNANGNQFAFPNSSNPPQNNQASADYGVRASYTSPTNFDINLAFRSILFDLSSAQLALSGGSFTASGLTLFPLGMFYSRNNPDLVEGGAAVSSNIALDYGGSDGVTPRDDPNNVGSNTGSLEVSGTTATLTFPLQFDYDETSTDGDNLTYRLAGTIVATGTLTQAPFDPTLYANYHGLTGNDALPGSDKDGDGQDNRTEMSFGSHPDDASSKGNIHLQFFDDGGDAAVAITFPVRTGGSVAGGNYQNGSVTYAPRSGNVPDAVSSTLTEVTPAITAGLPTLTGPYEYKTFRISGTSPTRAFFQVSIQ